MTEHNINDHETTPEDSRKYMPFALFVTVIGLSFIGISITLAVNQMWAAALFAGSCSGYLFALGYDSYRAAKKAGH